MSSPTEAELEQWNAALAGIGPAGLVRWAVARAPGRTVVSTNFRPYEAVLLHLAVQARPDIPVLWVDHGYNRPATYRHVEQLRQLLGLNLRPYLPILTPAHRDAVYGPVPGPDDEAALQSFSKLMKLEPFQRGMRELAPAVWLTALRRVQSPGRRNLRLVDWDAALGVLKVSPVLDWDDAAMEDYLRRHGLPNEQDYFDPAKADEKRECGLHARWGGPTLAGREAAG